jgi:hypothetical protein
MTRPAEIIWFERLIIATLILGELNTWLAWPQLVEKTGPAFIIMVQLFTVAIVLGLALLVSRRRSNIAKWISIALFALGSPFWLWQLLSGSLLGSPIISIIQVVGQVAAFTMLFTTASRRWFKKEAAPALA